MEDTLGDRMKQYERIGATERLMPGLPVIVRLDGRSFHSFTHGLRRPYDDRLSSLMQATTIHLAEESSARIAYTQSDEITLLLHSDDHKSQIYFDGKRDKIISVLAGVAAVHFNRLLPHAIPEKASSMAIFDARAFSLPSKQEAVNCLVWREQDAVRNSISMAAQHYFSHRELQGVNCNHMQEMLHSLAGINWNDYPDFFKRGRYTQRRTVYAAFSALELARLPPKHDAHRDPGLLIQRREFAEITMPRLTQITNQIDVLFNGAVPETKPPATET